MTGMIRPAHPGGLDEICRIEEASFSVPWKRSDYEALIGLEDAVFLVICGGGGATDEAVLGYGCIRQAADEGDLLSIAVREDLRGTGCGTRLLDALLSGAEAKGTERVFLEVRESNLPAIRMYEKAGFEKVGVRKRYYTCPAEDALLMRRVGEERGDVRNGI